VPDEPPPGFIVKHSPEKIADWNDERAIRVQLDQAIALG
jgi:hypothetical protein